MHSRHVAQWWERLCHNHHHHHVCFFQCSFLTTSSVPRTSDLPDQVIGIWILFHPCWYGLLSYDFLNKYSWIWPRELRWMSTGRVYAHCLLMWSLLLLLTVTENPHCVTICPVHLLFHSVVQWYRCRFSAVLAGMLSLDILSVSDLYNIMTTVVN